jgi:hypothetical protein
MAARKSVAISRASWYVVCVAVCACVGSYGQAQPDSQPVDICRVLMSPSTAKKPIRIAARLNYNYYGDDCTSGITGMFADDDRLRPSVRAHVSGNSALQEFNRMVQEQPPTPPCPAGKACADIEGRRIVGMPSAYLYLEVEVVGRVYRWKRAMRCAAHDPPCVPDFPYVLVIYRVEKVKPGLRLYPVVSPDTTSSQVCTKKLNCSLTSRREGTTIAQAGSPTTSPEGRPNQPQTYRGSYSISCFVKNAMNSACKSNLRWCSA